MDGPYLCAHLCWLSEATLSSQQTPLLGSPGLCVPSSQRLLRLRAGSNLVGCDSEYRAPGLDQMAGWPAGALADRLSVSCPEEGLRSILGKDCLEGFWVICRLWA